MTPTSPAEIDEEPAWDIEPNPEIVHWQPVHGRDKERTRPPAVSTAGALGAIAVGSAVVGALAVGALAIGAVAIGALAVGRARVRRLEIDELIVGQVRFKD
jgi:hypothetical protein